jgi:hypothetical protein
MKFLKTIRLDASDEAVFEVAAAPDEWAIPGGFAFAGITAGELTGKTRQAFANGFLSLQSLGRSTFASVAGITAEECDALTRQLAGHLHASFGAPNRAAAEAPAWDEIAFVTGLCRDVPVNTLFTLRRTLDGSGEIREEFRTIAAPRGVPHARVWEIVDDDGDGAGRGAG